MTETRVIRQQEDAVMGSMRGCPPRLLRFLTLAVLAAEGVLELGPGLGPLGLGHVVPEDARHLEQAGAAIALTGEVTPGQLQTAVGPLLADAHLRQAMAKRARAYGRPDAADRLVDEILAAAPGQPVTGQAGRRGEPSLPR